MLLKRVFGVKSVKKDGGCGNGYAGEAEGALSGLFYEANGASAGGAFLVGRHGVGVVEDGGEVVFVECGGEDGDFWGWWGWTRCCCHGWLYLSLRVVERVVLVGGGRREENGE